MAEYFKRILRIFASLQVKRHKKLQPVNSMYDKNIVQLTAHFEGCEQELVYVAKKEDERINHYISEKLEEINKLFGSQEVKVVYLPKLAERLNETEVLRYWNPLRNEHSEKCKRVTVGNDYMLRFFSRSARKQIEQGLLWMRVSYHDYDWGSNSKTYPYEFFPLSTDSEMDLPEQFKQIIWNIWKTRCNEAVNRDTCYIDATDEEIYADEYFNTQQNEESIDDLLKEIRERVMKLRQRGVAEIILQELIHPKVKLSRLVITKDFRLLLPDYHDMEIKMEPLVKAVYLLFLNHPDGIRFKELPDYRDELTEIYLKLKPNGLTDRARKSIEDVTNPLLNSINEKCARIRGAFVGLFDNHLAKYYYIDGQRSEPKKIALERSLVAWE